MAFILTLFCERPTRPVDVRNGVLRIEPVTQDDQSWARAGYLRGVERRIGRELQASGYYVLLEDAEGYRSSDALFRYPDDDNEPVQLAIADEYRQHFDEFLARALAASGDGRILVVLEYNGSVTGLEDTTEADVDILGPMNRDEFWRFHDLGELVEDSIIVIEP